MDDLSRDELTSTVWRQLGWCDAAYLMYKRSGLTPREFVASTEWTAGDYERILWSAAPGYATRVTAYVLRDMRDALPFPPEHTRREAVWNYAMGVLLHGLDSEGGDVCSAEYVALANDMITDLNDVIEGHYDHGCAIWPQDRDYFALWFALRAAIYARLKVWHVRNVGMLGLPSCPLDAHLPLSPDTRGYRALQIAVDTGWPTIVRELRATLARRGVGVRDE